MSDAAPAPSSGALPDRGGAELHSDSFSDGGRFGGVDQAVEAGVALADAGADWIDVGGESTRPASTPVAADEEERRVVPVLEALRARLGTRVRLSIDTYKACTARAALRAGATVVNDVSEGRLDPALLRVAADAGAGVVVGHLRGQPATMMDQIAFADVVTEVTGELGSGWRRRGRLVAGRSGEIRVSVLVSNWSTTSPC